MATLVDTRSFTGEAAEERWRATVHELLGLTVEVERVAPAPFKNRLTRHELGPLTLTDLQGEAQQTTISPPQPPWPLHRSVIACMALYGSGYIEQEGERVRIAPGVISICSGMKPRVVTRVSAFRNVTMHVPQGALDVHLQGRSIRTPCTVDATKGPAALLCDFAVATLARCAEAPSEARAALADVLLRLFATSLLHGREITHSTGGAEASHRARVRDFVLRHLRDPNLSVEMIGQGVGLSARYLHQLYASQEQPLMRWIWAMRLDGARADLDSADQRTIAQIATAWGFADPAHFSRAFKKRFGDTPAQARRAVHRDLQTVQ